MTLKICIDVTFNENWKKVGKKHSLKDTQNKPDDSNIIRIFI